MSDMGAGKGEKKRMTRVWSRNQYEVCSLCGDMKDRKDMVSATRCRACSKNAVIAHYMRVLTRSY